MSMRRIRLTFPQDLIKEPVIFRMANKYNLIPNIRGAKITETVGEVVLEVEGNEDDLDNGVKYLKEEGVIVEPVTGDIIQ